MEAQTKTQNQRIVLKHVGAPLVAESWDSNGARKLWYSWPFPALTCWEVEVGNTSIRKEVRSADAERCSRYHLHH